MAEEDDEEEDLREDQPGDDEDVFDYSLGTRSTRMPATSRTSRALTSAFADDWDIAAIHELGKNDETMNMETMHGHTACIAPGTTGSYSTGCLIHRRLTRGLKRSSSGERWCELDAVIEVENGPARRRHRIHLVNVHAASHIGHVHKFLDALLAELADRLKGRRWIRMLMGDFSAQLTDPAATTTAKTTTRAQTAGATTPTTAATPQRSRQRTPDAPGGNDDDGADDPTPEEGDGEERKENAHICLDTEAAKHRAGHHGYTGTMTIPSDHALIYQDIHFGEDTWRAAAEAERGRPTPIGWALHDPRS